MTAESRETYLANLRDRLRRIHRGEAVPPTPTRIAAPTFALAASEVAPPPEVAPAPVEPVEAVEEAPAVEEPAPPSTVVHPHVAELAAIVEGELSHASIETLLVVARRLARAEER